MKRTLAILLAMILALSMAACQPAPSTPATTTAAATTAAATTAAATAATEFSYPIKDGPTFTYWVQLHANISPFTNDFGTTELVRHWTEATGVKLTFEHPAAGDSQALEALNVLFASGKYPDFIHYQWTKYTGGVDKLYAEKIARKLDDGIAQWSPNFSKYVADHKLESLVKADDGSIYKYPMLMDGPLLVNTSGPQYRTDLAKKYNITAPQTIADWKAYLTAIKGDVESPFVGDMLVIQEAFSRAYGVHWLFYNEDGKVKFGPVEPGFKDFITEMTGWYKDGLLDRNFSTSVRKDWDAAMSSGTGGAIRGSGGQQLGVYIPALKKVLPDADLAATRYPTLDANTRARYVSTTLWKDSGNVVLTSHIQDKDFEAAIRFMDYGYSPKGILALNYGEEGKTYTMVNGVPTYTEFMTKPTDGKSFQQQLSNWTFSNWNGPFVQHEPYIVQYYELPQQKEALTAWSDLDKDYLQMPPITMTPEEASEFSKIMGDVTSYVDEMKIKFIMGNESLDKYDAFVAEINGMNIKRAIEIQQAALDRYLKR